MKQAITPHPDQEELESALKIINDWELHWYQLLYTQTPKLTHPGDKGYPFTVRMHPKYRACIQFIAEQSPEYSFTIRGVDPRPQDERDAEVLEWCKRILTAIEGKKEKPNSRACCGLAEGTNCVCHYSCKCPLHGDMHIGTHD